MMRHAVSRKEAEKCGSRPCGENVRLPEALTRKANYKRCKRLNGDWRSFEPAL